MFSDAHAHLTDAKYCGETESIVKKCIENNVRLIVNSGFDLISSVQSKELSEKHDEIYFTAGVHPDEARTFDEKTENRIIELLKPKYITRLTILGGEPLIERNIEPLTALLKRVKSVYPDKQVWLYTGGDFEVLEGLYEEIFQYIDILIDGRYVDDLRDYKLKWRGSSNQRIIDVQASLKSGNVVFSSENM